MVYRVRLPLALAFWLTLCGTAVAQPVTVTVDPGTTHQTFESWEVTAEHYHFDVPDYGDAHPVPDAILAALLDDAVNVLGLNGLRVELQMQGDQASSHNMEAPNDNADPNLLDASGIKWTWVDPYIDKIAKPMKALVEARGERFVLNLSVIGWEGWQWLQPEEYAEFVVANLDRLQSVHAIAPTYLTIYNEPNISQGAETRDDIVAAMKSLISRMNAAGHGAVRLRYPDTSTIGAARTYFQHLLGHADAAVILARLGQLSFHGYGGYDNAILNQLRDLAGGQGLTTAQTEWWFTDYHAPDLLSALTEANVTVYQPYALGTFPSTDPDARGLYGIDHTGGTFPDHQFTSFIRKRDWAELFHFSAFIRPGDVRLAASSSASSARAVAFAGPTGCHAIVIFNQSDAAIDIEVTGQAAGEYDVYVSGPVNTSVWPSPAAAQQASQSVGVAGTLAHSGLPGRGLITFQQIGLDDGASCDDTGPGTGVDAGQDSDAGLGDDAGGAGTAGDGNADGGAAGESAGSGGSGPDGEAGSGGQAAGSGGAGSGAAAGSGTAGQSLDGGKPAGSGSSSGNGCGCSAVGALPVSFPFAAPLIVTLAFLLLRRRRGRGGRRP